MNIASKLPKIRLSKKVIIIFIGIFAFLTLASGVVYGFYSGALVVQTDEYKQHQEAKSALKDEIVNLNSQITTLNDANTTKTTQISDLEKEYTENASKVEALNSEIGSLNTQIDAKWWDVYNAKIKYQDYYAMKTVLQRGAGALYGITLSMGEVDANIATSKAAFDQQTAEYDAMVANRDSKNNEKSALETRQGEINTSKENLTKEIEANKTKIAELQSELDAKDASLPELINRVESSMHWTQKVNVFLNDTF